MVLGRKSSAHKLSRWNGIPQVRSCVFKQFSEGNQLVMDNVLTWCGWDRGGICRRHWGTLAFSAALVLANAVVLAVSTHADLLQSCFTYLAACLWTFSSALMLWAVKGSHTGLAYSSTGLILEHALYAAFLSFSLVILILHLRKPRVFLALLQTSVIWESQRRSTVILTPTYFASGSVLRVWP